MQQAGEPASEQCPLSGHQGNGTDTHAFEFVPRRVGMCLVGPFVRMGEENRTSVDTTYNPLALPDEDGIAIAVDRVDRILGGRRLAVGPSQTVLGVEDQLEGCPVVPAWCRAVQLDEQIGTMSRPTCVRFCLMLRGQDCPIREGNRAVEGRTMRYGRHQAAPTRAEKAGCFLFDPHGTPDLVEIPQVLDAQPDVSRDRGERQQSVSVRSEQVSIARGSLDDEVGGVQPIRCFPEEVLAQPVSDRGQAAVHDGAEFGIIPRLTLLGSNLRQQPSQVPKGAGHESIGWGVEGTGPMAIRQSIRQQLNPDADLSSASSQGCPSGHGVRAAQSVDGSWRDRTGQVHVRLACNLLQGSFDRVEEGIEDLIAFRKGQVGPMRELACNRGRWQQANDHPDTVASQFVKHLLEVAPELQFGGKYLEAQADKAASTLVEVQIEEADATFEVDRTCKDLAATGGVLQGTSDPGVFVFERQGPAALVMLPRYFERSGFPQQGSWKASL